MADTRIEKGIGQKLFANNTANKQQFVGADIARKIGLTQADRAEYQKTGTYSQPAQALIDKYKAGGRVPLVESPTTLSTGQSVDSTTMGISNQNSTYGKDPAVDKIIASQYVNPADKKMETYTDKIGMETGIYADIQNIDTKVLDTYKILGMSDQDIFSRKDISAEEKVAMSNQRKEIATNRITQLRKIQQAKQDEIKTLAEYEAKKAEEQQKQYKRALDYMKEINDAKKLDLEENKFDLDVFKTNEELKLKTEQLNLDKKEFEDKKYETYFKGITNKTLLDAPDGTIIKSRLSETTNPNGGKECGEYVNDVIGGTIPRFGNTYDDKLKVANEDYGTIGAAAVWNPGNNINGHVGIIVGEQGDNWIIKSSNLRNDGAISTDLIPKNDIQGYRNTNVKTDQNKNPDFNFSTGYDYINSTIPNIAKVIPPETAKKVVINDMSTLSLASLNKDGEVITPKLDELRAGGKITKDIYNAYTGIAQAYLAWKPMGDEDVLSNLKDTFSGADEETKKDILVELAIAGKLQGPLFESSWYNDGDGYDLLDDNFDNADAVIKAANDKATQLKKQYNLK